jgi:acetyl-CoA C-acetyltransferase
MTTGNKTAPLLVSAAQYTQSKNAVPALDPLGLMIKASRAAFADAGSAGLVALVDTVCVVNSFSRDDERAPHALAAALGLRPRELIYSTIGGNSPQKLVNRFARDIAAGRRKAVLISGAEAVYALYRTSRGKTTLHWPDNITLQQLKANNLPANFDAMLRLGCDHEKEILEARGDKYEEPNNRIEKAYDLFLPQYMYPFFETALRSLTGRTPEEHRLYMGRRYERLSRIAADNPYAWNRKALSAEEITKPSAHNRYVVYPYTLRMMSNINVDQAAALIMTGADDAVALGIERSRWIYPMGGAELNNIWHVTQRPRLDDSPAITEASRLALRQAGLSLGDIGIFDLYSCFPSALEISRRAIGIPENDSRDLTVTGGLAYFGGPGNNYSLHAIVSSMEHIRRDRRLKVMVTANGWYNSKHAIGIYGAEPPDHPWEDEEYSAIQQSIDAAALSEPVERVDGLLTVEAYSMRYDTTGNPERITVIGRLPNGSRALADVQAETAEMRKLEQVKLAGRTGEARFNSVAGRNSVVFDPALYQ